MTDVEKLRAALAPFAAAYKRLREYDEHEPPDFAPLFAEHDSCGFELLDGEKGPQVMVGNLRAASEALDGTDTT